MSGNFSEDSGVTLERRLSSNQAGSQSLLQQVTSLLLYQNVLQGEVGQAYLQLLRSLNSTPFDPLSTLQAYGQWFRALAARGQNWEDYLVEQILKDDNPFSQCISQQGTGFPAVFQAAVSHDLEVLQQLYNHGGKHLCEWVQQHCQLAVSPIVWQLSDVDLGKNATINANFRQPPNQWTPESLATYYRRHGIGLFAEYRAARWQNGQLIGIAYPDLVRLDQLVAYEIPKQTLVKNTEFLLAGYPALHVLLYGGRGCGKSSLVKALLNEYSDRGLRLIEVTKSELLHLPEITEHLRDLPQKFIIFVDDLSFEADEDAYKSLKVVLEGNVTARPDNVVVYATSNRRHLIREFFADRPRPSSADEVHAWDTVQEQLSFSDRFGLTLTFEPANQDTYLQIVHTLAQQCNLSIQPDELTFQALQWATRHNGRSGRTARQFIDFLQADLS
jgi:uncharacterized protein